MRGFGLPHYFEQLCYPRGLHYLHDFAKLELDELRVDPTLFLACLSKLGRAVRPVEDRLRVESLDPLFQLRA